MMVRKFLLMSFLFIVSIGGFACSSQPKPDSQSDSKGEERYEVANDISLKIGTNFDGETVLGSADFVGFNYKYNESKQEYEFTFKLTDEGQEKMADATTKLAETSGDLSLWIGDELISSPKVMGPITGGAFNIIFEDISEDNVSDFIDKLEGKQS